MANALVKSSSFVIMPDGVETKARLLELSGVPEFSDTFEQIERDVIRQAFSTYAPIRGLETTSGSCAVELHGSGAYDTPPESALLYRAAMGNSMGPAVSDTWQQVDEVLTTLVVSAVEGEPNTTFTDPVMYDNAITVTTAEGALFKVGYPVRVLDTTGATLRLAGFISDITGDVITVLSSHDGSTVVATDILDCGFLYSLRQDVADVQVTEMPALQLDYFRGDITRESWTGAIVTEFSLDCSTGQLVIPSFSWEGTSVDYSTSTYAAYDTNYTSINTTFDSSTTSPIVVQLTDIFMEANSDNTAFETCISNLQFTVMNSVYKKQCVQTEGIGEVIRTSREVTGSLNTFYEDKTLQDSFKADETYYLRALFNYTSASDSSGVRSHADAEIGNMVAIVAGQLKFSEVSINEEEGIYKYENSFSCEPTSGDDEFYLAFL